MCQNQTIKYSNCAVSAAVLCSADRGPSSATSVQTPTQQLFKWGRVVQFSME